MLKESENNNFYLNNNHDIKNKIIDGIFLNTPKKIYTPDYNIDLKELTNSKPDILSKKFYDIDKLEDIDGIAKTKNYSKAAKIIISLIMIFLFSIVPIKIINTTSNLKAQTQRTINDLEMVYPLIQSGDYDQTKERLLIIQKNIEVIKKSLSDLGQDNLFLDEFSQFQDDTANNSNLLDIVYSMSKIGNVLITDLEFSKNLNFSDINTSSTNSDVFARMKKLNSDLEKLEPEILSIKNKVNNLDESKFDLNNQKYILTLKENADKILNYYNSGLIASKNANSLLGEDYDRKYLILFQNNTELRPTGGFIGTYGIITVRDAKIKKIYIDSIYNADGQQTKNFTPPEPLSKMDPGHYMRNANWDPDFLTSASDIINMYETEGGFTPDGVIAIDTKPFLDLLAITGPIKISKYNTLIDKDNFLAVTQYKTSIDYNPQDGNPKKFLGEFAPLFLDKIFSIEKNNKGKITKILLDNIKEKHIQFYSPNTDIQSIFSSIDIDGAIKNSDSDYFAYINANIGGQKTNGLIEEVINHQVNISNDGKITHKVTLTRKHNGTYDWPSGINYSYVRFYLPQGSKVIDIKNFEKNDSIKRDGKTGMIYLEERSSEYLGKAEIKDLDISIEHGKTVVGAWQRIKPGEEVVSEIFYELPRLPGMKKPSQDYSILIQKQAGIIKQQTSIEIKDNGKTIFSKNFNLIKDTTINLNSK
ncbi:MAG TPA: DUF4012 domain-containing protein [Patescibacteria group bacterium]|nr:DUF4012 domain-containing protein [Patescibacteria group bacterium]